MTTSTDRVAPPALPVPDAQYSRMSIEHMNNVLRLFFNRLTSTVNDNVVNINSIFRPLVITETTTARSLSASDERAVILCTNGSAVTVTVDPDIGTDDPSTDGAYITHVYQQGAGQVTLAAGVGVTLNDASSLKTRAQYSSLSIIQIATNEYNIIGDME